MRKDYEHRRASLGIGHRFCDSSYGFVVEYACIMQNSVFSRGEERVFALVATELEAAEVVRRYRTSTLDTGETRAIMRLQRDTRGTSAASI